ncbi:MAG: hypothetical protein ACQEVA_05645 [Myxococcota bacterium]
MGIPRRILFSSTIFVLALALAGCGGCDDNSEGGGEDCPPGETWNPIQSQCVRSTGGEDGGLDADDATSDGTSEDGTSSDAEDGSTIPDVGVDELACLDEYTENLPDPEMIASEAGDYKLALPPGTAQEEVTGLSSNAHVFSDAANGYAGFVVSLSSLSVGSQDVDSHRDAVFSRISNVYGDADFLSTGRRTLTHDGYTALVRTKVKTGSISTADAARDSILEELTGGSVSHGLNQSFSNISGEALVNFGVIDRGSGEAIVTLTVSERSAYENDSGATGYLVDDVTGAMSVAEFIGQLTPECVAYEYENQAAADIILSIDVSTSMSDEYEAVRNYADTFVQILEQSNIDWRLGVTSSVCDGIDEDPEISPDVASLYGSECTQCDGGTVRNGQCCIELPGFGEQCFPLPATDLKNGQLCNGEMTNNADAFKQCVDDLLGSSGGSEFTATIGAAAIDRALPRTNSDASKLRPGAATIVLSVTDEFDQYVENKMGWPDGNNDGAHDPTTEAGFDWAAVEAVIQPFVDYYLSPEAAATLFGIHWIPGQSCSSATEAAAGIDRMTSLTGGSAGDLCGSNIGETLEEIAEASAGLASSIRLLGAPVPPSIQTRVGRVDEGRVDLVDRARDNGWDYDAVTNAVVFNGDAEPEVGETVVAAYYRWDDSIISCETDGDCPAAQKYICVDGQCR